MMWGWSHKLLNKSISTWPSSSLRQKSKPWLSPPLLGLGARLAGWPSARRSLHRGRRKRKQSHRQRAASVAGPCGRPLQRCPAPHLSPRSLRQAATASPLRVLKQRTVSFTWALKSIRNSIAPGSSSRQAGKTLTSCQPGFEEGILRGDTFPVNKRNEQGRPSDAQTVKWVSKAGKCPVVTEWIPFPSASKHLAAGLPQRRTAKASQHISRAGRNLWPQDAPLAGPRRDRVSERHTLEGRH